MYEATFTLEGSDDTFTFKAQCLAWLIEGLAFNVEPYGLEDAVDSLTITIIED